MSEWQDIATAPSVDRTHQWAKFDVYAERYELVDTKTGRTRRVVKRFPEVTKRIVFDLYGSPLQDTIVWDGIDTSWNATHWMPLPKPPGDDE